MIFSEPTDADCPHLRHLRVARSWQRTRNQSISDNDRKYYSLERAREVLGYDPQDNSAHWDGDEHVAGER
jgi:NAD+ dependent glucose-6-phosphate dehydrogenase